MAQPRRSVLPIIVALFLSSLLIGTLGKLECEDLPVEDCAFSVSSSGARCVLEKYRGKDDITHIECQSSIIMATKQEEWIESEECVKSCGLERMSFGLSTDLLLDTHFTEMLCSPECLNNCPNIIDLYISLAAGEGMYLPQLCKTHRMSSRRLIVDPVKKAIDAEYLRSLFLPSLTSNGELAPLGSTIPANGASGRGYGRHGYGDTFGLEPTASPSDDAPPMQTGGGPPASSTDGPIGTPYDRRTGRPFFHKAPPTVGSPTSASSTTGGTSPPAAAPLGFFGVLPPSGQPEAAPSPAPVGSEIALAAATDIHAAGKVALERPPLDDEELIYETYFH